MNIILLAGCVLAGFGIYRLFMYFRFFKKGIVVEGKIVAVSSFRNSKGITLHAPVVQYKFEGRTQRITGETGTFFRPKLGKKMTVGIHPQNTAQRRLKQKSFVFVHLIFIGLGSFWIALYLVRRFAPPHTLVNLLRPLF